MVVARAAPGQTRRVSELRIIGTQAGAIDVAITYEDCAAMPRSAQVADVSKLVPGRAGSAVLLAALLERVRAGGARYLNVASTDPGFAVCLSLTEVSSALVVYALDGAPLPAAKGGPFRLLVPGHSDECVHVKSVATIALAERPGRDTRPVDSAEHEKLHQAKKR